MHHSKNPSGDLPYMPRFLSVILLVMTVISLIGCKCSPINDDLEWLQPIEFSDSTKEWLLDRSPWPSYVRHDLNQIAILNDTIREIKE